jgi:hypothetical protein
MRQHEPGTPPGASQTTRRADLPPWWSPRETVSEPTPLATEGQLSLEDLVPQTALAETSLQLRALPARG